MQVDKTKEKGLFSSSGSEAQASKRQKLDGGLLRKVECLVVLCFFVVLSLKCFTRCSKKFFLLSFDLK